MKVKEESEKAGLKLSIQKTKIMAFGPITSWQKYGETVTDFIFVGFKIINSLTFSFLYSPTFISIHDYWKNHSFN